MMKESHSYADERKPFTYGLIMCAITNAHMHNLKHYFHVKDLRFSIWKQNYITSNIIIHIEISWQFLPVILLR